MNVRTRPFIIHFQGQGGTKAARGPNRDALLSFGCFCLKISFFFCLLWILYVVF